ncbi:hypothetical protein AWJ14_02485 [Hoeflea olei]|uniref:OmpA-like domain-containing protein n=2 Tax=Hoeflea olei TaxID=1480615 RepID=A0A1C1YVY1_9HYPH|nr:hypothetical protein AWJ14_02485 [Hoeflea olei]
MGDWKRCIWPGLASVGCLTALAVWFEAPAVEADLKGRAQAALRQGHGWAQLSLTGRDLTLQGVAPDEASQASGLALVRGVYGVRTATDNSTLLPEAKPYRLTFEKGADGVMLRGVVPNDTVRAELIGILSGMLPGIALSDRMQPARGAPDGLVALAAYGLAAFTRFSTGTIEISDRTLTVRGQALNPDDHELALTALKAIPASAGSVKSIDITPAAAPGVYGWTASRGPDGVVLEGYAPDAPTRVAIVARAKALLPGIPVEDRMRFAAGLPAGLDLAKAADGALAVLADLAEGTAGLSGAVLDLEGRAVDGAAFRRIQQRLSGPLAGGVRLGSADIGGSAGLADGWTVRRDGDGITLRGALPSAAAWGRVMDLARLKFGTLPLHDSREVADGAPDGLEAAARAGLQALSRLREGELRIAGDTVSIKGVALSDAASGDIARRLAEEMPAGFAASTAIAVAPVPAEVLAPSDCQAELNHLARLNTVLFETGQAVIETHSYGYLDQIAFAARQCGAVRLEIAGHTDSDGTETDNLKLSSRRADAVLSYLRQAGVAADRMRAVGYGESRPVNGNETDADKAANRRIEFRVLDEPE